MENFSMVIKTVMEEMISSIHLKPLRNMIHAYARQIAPALEIHVHARAIPHVHAKAIHRVHARAILAITAHACIWVVLYTGFNFQYFQIKTNQFQFVIKYRASEKNQLFSWTRVINFLFSHLPDHIM
jgi:hypothetical protein